MCYVSVIIPNYNHSNFLAQRIDSVLSQTYGSFEVIILDDCSTDNSAAIINSFRHHPKISHIVCNTTNSGSTFRQWQKGLDLAKGELIWIAESDDYAEPFFLEKVTAVFQNFPHVGIVNVSSKWVDENNNVTLENDGNTGFQAPMRGVDFVAAHMTFRNAIYNASAVVFKKNLAKGIMTESLTDMRYCGDWLFWNRIILQTSIFLVGDKLNFFRRHDKVVSTGAEKEGLFFLEGIETYSELRNKLPSHFKGITSADKIWAKKLVVSSIPGVAKRNTLRKVICKLPFVLPLYIFYSLQKIVKTS